ncbi:transposase [Ningiella sp. W23]|uniref:transposase n=1 Tax=Ningiella sp. W23 TaxID=3023715 RepID=UPI0037579935
MCEHKRLDKSEAADEVRKQRAEQAIGTLNKAHDKIDKFLKTASPRKGQGKRSKEVKSNITDNESAKMNTSKGTVQGYNGVAAVDKKHQIIVDAQAFGEGQERNILQPIIDTINKRFTRLGIAEDIVHSGTVITADTGFSSEDNNRYLYEQNINGYIPDNQFRQRDPKFANQKEKYPRKRPRVFRVKNIPASEFSFDPVSLTCICPNNESLTHRVTRVNENGVKTAYFEGRLLQCRHCDKKHQCMRNPSSADHSKGSGRQVSFALPETSALIIPIG